MLTKPAQSRLGWLQQTTAASSKNCFSGAGLRGYSQCWQVPQGAECHEHTRSVPVSSRGSVSVLPLPPSLSWGCSGQSLHSPSCACLNHCHLSLVLALLSRTGCCCCACAPLKAKSWGWCTKEQLIGHSLTWFHSSHSAQEHHTRGMSREQPVCWDMPQRRGKMCFPFFVRQLQELSKLYYFFLLQQNMFWFGIFCLFVIK